MSGRFTLCRQEGRELAMLRGADEDDLRDYRLHYNIAPMQVRFMILSKYESETISARWALVNRWTTNSSCADSCINAKAKTIETRPSFKDAAAKRRCKIPADCFYEWRGSKNNR
jgi:putative SOS response-associated peptidase YedK